MHFAHQISGMDFVALVILNGLLPLHARTLYLAPSEIVLGVELVKFAWLLALPRDGAPRAVIFRSETWRAAAACSMLYLINNVLVLYALRRCTPSTVTGMLQLKVLASWFFSESPPRSAKRMGFVVCVTLGAALIAQGEVRGAFLSIASLVLVCVLSGMAGFISEHAMRRNSAAEFSFALSCMSLPMALPALLGLLQRSPTEIAWAAPTFVGHACIGLLSGLVTRNHSSLGKSLAGVLGLVLLFCVEGEAFDAWRFAGVLLVITGMLGLALTASGVHSLNAPPAEQTKHR